MPVDPARLPLPSTDFSINLDGCTISQTHSFKNLRIAFSHSLTFEPHIKCTIWTAFCHPRKITKLLPLLSLSYCQVMALTHLAPWSFTCWRETLDMPPGRHWRQYILEALEGLSHTPPRTAYTHILNWTSTNVRKAGPLAWRSSSWGRLKGHLVRPS